ncbi:MAG: hypothetical protein HY809_09250 [Nitrospirae bacterium]|nr:hypothetical protein [Nitrospirota bacterium]
MNFIVKAFRYLASFEFFIALLVTFGSMAIFFLKYYGMDLRHFASLAPSRLYIALMLINRLSGAIGQIKSGNRGVLLSAGIVVCLSGIIIDDCFRFDGIASLGEKEELAYYETVESGLFAGVPLTRLMLWEMQEIKDEPGKEIFIFVNERNEQKRAAAGEAFGMKPFVNARFLSANPAPRFRLMSESGNEIETAFVKLKLGHAGSGDYFKVRDIPHRIYFSMTGKEDKPYKVKVMRGKITSAEEEIGPNDGIAFDGMILSFPEMGKWAELRVTRYPGTAPFYAGLIVSAAGILPFLRRRG